MSLVCLASLAVANSHHHLPIPLPPPMGRWTQNYTDEVLVTKIANIINGAIQRSQEKPDENMKLQISYENFVESLDDEDSFTKSLVEILFKEIADRRSRPPTSEKSQINPRTALALRELAGHARYVPRFRHRQLQTQPLPDVGASNYESSDMLEDEETDDFGMADGLGNMEGARIDSSLYDMYNTRAVAPSGSFPRNIRLAADELYQHHPWMSRRDQTVPRTLPEYAAALASQNPPREPHLFSHWSHRPPRARRMPNSLGGTDFSDFTARRRSIRRLASRQAAPIEREREDNDNDATPRPANAVPVPMLPSTLARAARSDLPRASIFEPPSPRPGEQGARSGASSPSFDADDEAFRHVLESIGASNTQLYTSGAMHNPGAYFSAWAPSSAAATSSSTSTSTSLNPPGAPRLPSMTEAFPLPRGEALPNPHRAPRRLYQPLDAPNVSSPVGTRDGLLHPEHGFLGVGSAANSPEMRESNLTRILREGPQERQPQVEFVPLPEGPLSLPTPRSVSPPEQNDPPGAGPGPSDNVAEQ